MSRSLRRGAAAALALALLPLAAACSAGTGAETTKIRPNSAHTMLGQVKIQNLQLVTGAPGTGLVSLGGAFVNNGTDPVVITKVTVQGVAPAALKGPSGESGTLTVPGTRTPPPPVPTPGWTGNALYITGAANQATITFSGASSLAPGSYQTVTFDFATQGEVSVPVTVQTGENPLYTSLAPQAPNAPATHAAAPASAPAAPEPGSAGPTTGTYGTPTAGPTAGSSATATASATAGGTPKP